MSATETVTYKQILQAAICLCCFLIVLQIYVSHFLLRCNVSNYNSPWCILWISRAIWLFPLMQLHLRSTISHRIFLFQKIGKRKHGLTRAMWHKTSQKQTNKQTNNPPPPEKKHVIKNLVFFNYQVHCLFFTWLD